MSVPAAGRRTADSYICYSSETGFVICTPSMLTRPTESPVGEPFVVQHLHDPRRRWGSTPFGTAIVSRAFVFNQIESTGSIWLLDPGLTPGSRTDHEPARRIEATANCTGKLAPVAESLCCTSAGQTPALPAIRMCLRPTQVLYNAVLFIQVKPVGCSPIGGSVRGILACCIGGTLHLAGPFAAPAPVAVVASGRLLNTWRLLITNLRNDEITGCHDGVPVSRQLSENRRS